MPFSKTSFFALPQSAQRALGFLAAAWVSLLAFVYHFHLSFSGKINGNDALRVVVVGAAICYFVFKIKPWARRLCIFFNIGIIGINLFFVGIRVSALGVTSFALTAHALVNAVLFIASTYYLLVEPTAKYFQARVPKAAQQESAAGR